MIDKAAVQLRALQLYAHHAHNNCQGATFLQDHGLFGDTYSAAESDYDDVVERIIGMSSKTVDTLAIAEQAVKIASSMPKDGGDCNCAFLASVLRLEVSICAIIEKCVAGSGYPEGTKQLLGGIADKSMVRQYKLKQRMK